MDARLPSPSYDARLRDCGPAVSRPLGWPRGAHLDIIDALGRSRPVGAGRDAFEPVVASARGPESSADQPSHKVDLYFPDAVMARAPLPPPAAPALNGHAHTQPAVSTDPVAALTEQIGVVREQLIEARRRAEARSARVEAVARDAIAAALDQLEREHTAAVEALRNDTRTEVERLLAEARRIASNGGAS